MMNKRIKELIKQAECVVEGDGYGDGNIELLIQLVVKECADIADEMEEIGCEYPGDAMVERFGFGEEEGAATWRTK